MLYPAPVCALSRNRKTTLQDSSDVILTSSNVKEQAVYLSRSRTGISTMLPSNRAAAVAEEQGTNGLHDEPEHDPTALRHHLAEFPEPFP